MERLKFDHIKIILTIDYIKLLSMYLENIWPKI